MTRLRSAVVAGLAVLQVCAALRAEVDNPPPRQADASQPSAPPDKSGYTLFNPVPRSMLRELQTDRPDQTEGPFTVDAGHLQAELDLVNYSYDRRQPAGQHVTQQSLLIAPTNFRLGLLENLEFDLITAPFIWQRDVDRLSRSSNERAGIGDVTLRAKVNFFGNDSGNIALGLIPYVKLPTHQAHLGNPYVEGGVILPLTIKLPDTWEIDAMTEGDVLRNSTTAGYHASWTNSVAIHRDLIKDKLNGYAEYLITVSRDRHAGPVEWADFGLLLAVNENVQLDCGINLGLTRSAVDYNPFVGLSIRF